MTVQVRPATVDDIPDLVDLSASLWRADIERYDPVLNLESLVQAGGDYHRAALSDPAAATLLACAGALAVGMIVGRVSAPRPARPVRTAGVETLYVEPAYRGRGVGSLLLHEFVRWAREQDADAVTVSTYSENAQAVAFYRGHGFRERSVLLKADLRDVPVDPVGK